jgi:hypothetical protein
MAQASGGFEWKENMACVATYNILEGENFLDQFEDADIPFDEAAKVPMGKLRYFPKTTTNAEIIRLLSLQIAQRFLTDLVKTFTVKKEMPAKATGDTITELAVIFADKKKTIRDLAEVVDENVKFPDEA